MSYMAPIPMLAPGMPLIINSIARQSDGAPPDLEAQLAVIHCKSRIQDVDVYL